MHSDLKITISLEEILEILDSLGLPRLRSAVGWYLG